MGQKRRTNPSFLSKDEAERDKTRTEQMVRSLVEGVNYDMILSNKSPDSNLISTPKRVLSDEFTVSEDHIITDRNYKRIYDLADRSNKKARGPKYFPKSCLHKSQSDQIKKHSQPTIELLGETQNFVVQLNNETHLIELYGKDFFIGKLFKLKIHVGESLEITRLLTQARNKIEQKQKARVGETSHFVVDVDGSQRLAILYEKNNEDVKLGFSESEITPILNFLAKARALF